MLAASMLVIGDEILGGYTQDTNSPWLAQRLRVHGVPLERVHVVPDTPEAIDEALQAELARARPRIVVTSGGIGSTPDDLTYEAVAASLGRDLVEDPVISERVADVLERSRRQGHEVSEAIAWHLGRMARIPAGSRVLLRDGGWTTAVTVDVDGGSDAGGATVVVLPGMPPEFRVLIEQTVEPALLAGRNEPPTVVEIEHTLPESALNLAFVHLTEAWPQVKLGSYPGRPMIVRLSGDRGEVTQAEAYVTAQIEALNASLGRAAGQVHADEEAP